MKPIPANRPPLLVASFLLCLLPACLQHKVDLEPIEIEPIHITMDINLKVQRELDDFFDFEADSEDTPTDPSNGSEDTKR